MHFSTAIAALLVGSNALALPVDPAIGTKFGTNDAPTPKNVLSDIQTLGTPIDSLNVLPQEIKHNGPLPNPKDTVPQVSGLGSEAVTMHGGHTKRGWQSAFAAGIKIGIGSLLAWGTGEITEAIQGKDDRRVVREP
jgi:hypothetical protein